jgi:ATP-dependent DNA helicase RecQ
MGYIQILNWEYRSIGLTEACRPILRGELKIELKKLYRSKTTSKSKKESSKAKDFAETDNPELFEKLRLLRMQIAKEHKVPPYIVFGDKTLHDMCWVMPETKEQMLSVHGVGESKWERYGELFLQEIASYIQESARSSKAPAEASL